MLWLVISYNAAAQQNSVEMQHYNGNHLINKKLSWCWQQARRV